MNSCAPAVRAARSIASRAGVGMPERDVVRDGAAKQQALLEHDADVAAQGVQVQLAHVDAVDQDPAARGIVEARDQAEQRALAGAGRADERHAAPGLDLEIDGFEHQPPLVGEARPPRSGRRRGTGRAAPGWGGDSTSTGASSTSNTRRAPVTLCCSVLTMVAMPVICVANCCSRPANTISCPSVSASRATSEPP